METMEISTNAIMTVLGAVATVLTGAIGTLWRQNIRQNETQAAEVKASEARMVAELEKCETKHEAATEQLIGLAEKVGTLNGAESVAATIGEKLTAMHRDMLDEIRRK